MRGGKGEEKGARGEGKGRGESRYGRAAPGMKLPPRCTAVVTLFVGKALPLAELPYFILVCREGEEKRGRVPICPGPSHYSQLTGALEKVTGQEERATVSIARRRTGHCSAHWDARCVPSMSLQTLLPWGLCVCKIVSSTLSYLLVDPSGYLCLLSGLRPRQTWALCGLGQDQ